MLIHLFTYSQSCIANNGLHSLLLGWTLNFDAMAMSQERQENGHLKAHLDII